MRWDLVNKVLEDLKEVIPYKEDIVWEDCHSTSYLGRYYIKKNKIVVSDYITDEQDYMATVAHELIHAAGVHGHGLEFKEWMNKIDALNLPNFANMGGLIPCVRIMGGKPKYLKFINELITQIYED